MVDLSYGPLCAPTSLSEGSLAKLTCAITPTPGHLVLAAGQPESPDTSRLWWPPLLLCSGAFMGFSADGWEVGVSSKEVTVSPVLEGLALDSSRSHYRTLCDAHVWNTSDPSFPLTRPQSE